MSIDHLKLVKSIETSQIGPQRPKKSHKNQLKLPLKSVK